MKKMLNKIIVLGIVFLIFSVIGFTSALAVSDKANTYTENTNINQEIYSNQYHAVGADTLIEGLPKDIQKQLKSIGVTAPSWQQLNSMSVADIFNSLLTTAGQQAITPLNAVIKILGVIMLLALINSVKSTVNASSLSSVIDTVGVLSVSIILIYPITLVIEYACTVIKLSADFMMIFVPVMIAIMLTMGQSVQGASNYTIVMTACTVVSQISKGILLPFINTYMGMSVVSGITKKINLKGFCDLTYKVTKWVLTFTVSVFTAILTMQSIISSSADSAGTKATRFAISSFVPLVGGALSEAYQTVRGCMGLLKSGVGVFAILATGTIYLPAIISAVLWLIAINFSIALADVFDIGQITKLLKGTATVINIIIALLLCCMVIFIISSSIMLMIGGNN